MISLILGHLSLRLERSDVLPYQSSSELTVCQSRANSRPSEALDGIGVRLIASSHSAHRRSDHTHSIVGWPEVMVAITRA